MKLLWWYTEVVTRNTLMIWLNSPLFPTESTSCIYTSELGNNYSYIYLSFVFGGKNVIFRNIFLRLFVLGTLPTVTALMKNKLVLTKNLQFLLKIYKFYTEWNWFYLILSFIWIIFILAFNITKFPRNFTSWSVWWCQISSDRCFDQLLSTWLDFLLNTF